MKRTLLLISLLAVSAHLKAQMTVNSGPGVTPATMVNAITGGGIAVSNITTNSATATSRGTFTSTGIGNIGISSGIILTSGSADVAALTNTGSGQGAAINGLNDPDLAALTTGLVHDACVLEFDFIAVSDTAIFNYVFGSDEYSDYANTTFNDVFGFFVSGPGFTGNQNIALIPGTGVPVTINNVNNGGPVGHGTPLTGPCMNCAYFLDNSVQPIGYATAYDGLTTVLTATAAGLSPGLTYHLKMGVADVSDQVFDSGVFIEEGSYLTPGPPWIFAGGLRIMSDTLQICLGGSVQISAPSGFNYLWSTGESTQEITVSAAGAYSVTILGSNPLAPVFSDPINFVVVNTSVPQPMLSINGNSIISSVNNPAYTYSWTLNGNPVAGANAPTLNISQNGCYKVTVQETSGCFVSSDSLCITALNIIENNFQSAVSLYPNPFSQTAQLTFDNPEGELFSFVIMDLAGRTVFESEVSKSVLEIRKDNLQRGVYFYSLKNPNGDKAFNGRFVIN